MTTQWSDRSEALSQGEGSAGGGGPAPGAASGGAACGCGSSVATEQGEAAAAAMRLAKSEGVTAGGLSLRLRGPVGGVRGGSQSQSGVSSGCNEDCALRHACGTRLLLPEQRGVRADLPLMSAGSGVMDRSWILLIRTWGAAGSY